MLPTSSAAPFPSMGKGQLEITSQKGTPAESKAPHGAGTKPLEREKHRETLLFVLYDQDNHQSILNKIFPPKVFAF